MKEPTSSFGRLLTTQRKDVAKMPQWLLAARCEIVASNLRKIETGSTQPGVMLAVRLLAATGADVGESLRLLAEEEGLLALSAHHEGHAHELEHSEQSRKLEQVRKSAQDKGCPFGPIFKEVRVIFEVSQKIVAEKAKYHLRNILEVESGRREPGIMTALAMVCATGCDVAWFFSALNKHSTAIVH